MKRTILLLLVIALVLLIVFYHQNSPTVCFLDSCVKVEIADSDSERALGLMHRTSMPHDQGMLFVYDSEVVRRFWMKNTLIPLDIIWIGSDGRIVHIEHAPPCKADPCPSYGPSLQAKYVLEVNGGYMTEHGIDVGDYVTIRLPR